MEIHDTGSFGEAPSERLCRIVDLSREDFRAGRAPAVVVNRDDEVSVLLGQIRNQRLLSGQLMTKDQLVLYEVFA